MLTRPSTPELTEEDVVQYPGAPTITVKLTSRSPEKVDSTLNQTSYCLMTSRWEHGLKAFVHYMAKYIIIRETGFFGGQPMILQALRQ